MAKTRGRERGATLLMVTFVSAFLLIPAIGMCIDGAVLYWVKARLSSAVDAATLATARSLNVGSTVAQQESNAIATGAEYFTANFPPGIMKATVVGGQNVSSSINIDETQIHKRIVTLTVSVVVPLYFMRILGFANSTVTATGQATRRDANVMMVLDRSNSMNANGNCSALIADAEIFANNFVDGRDRVGLVTFQTGANVDYPPTLTFKSGTPTLNNTLNTLVCGGDTSTAQGLSLGYQQITTAINQPGALNVILLFTDGQPNTLVATFAIKRQTDTRYDANNTSQQVSTPASSCSAALPTLTGGLADGTAEVATSVSDLYATGATEGVLNYGGKNISDGSLPTTIPASGCAFQNWNTAYKARQDVVAIPSADFYGNSTLDRQMVPNLDVFTSGPYVGLIRPDMPRTVRWAAFNAADSMALTIRDDPTYVPVIYTIALQGNEPMAIDQDFMERMANDPRASNYDPTKAAGEFILATDKSEMAQAFEQIASQILRLSR